MSTQLIQICYIFCTIMALNGLFCADVPLRNYSLTDCTTDYQKRNIYLQIYQLWCAIILRDHIDSLISLFKA